jgi:hypothetical protein
MSSPHNPVGVLAVFSFFPKKKFSFCECLQVSNQPVATELPISVLCVECEIFSVGSVPNF